MSIYRGNLCYGSPPPSGDDENVIPGKIVAQTLAAIFALRESQMRERESRRAREKPQASADRCRVAKHHSFTLASAAVCRSLDPDLFGDLCGMAWGHAEAWKDLLGVLEDIKHPQAEDVKRITSIMPLSVVKIAEILLLGKPLQKD